MKIKTFFFFTGKTRYLTVIRAACIYLEREGALLNTITFMVSLLNKPRFVQVSCRRLGLTYKRVPERRATPWCGTLWFSDLSARLHRQVRHLLTDHDTNRPINKDPSNKLKNKLAQTLRDIKAQGGRSDHKYKRLYIPHQCSSPKVLWAPQNTQNCGGKGVG